MEEFAVIKGSTYISRFTELFTIPRVRRATLASFVVMIAQQVSKPSAPCCDLETLILDTFLLRRCAVGDSSILA